MSKLGINGFGRIGRLVLRRLLEVNSPLEVVAINDLTSPKVLAYLLKHDSNYGPFPWSVDFTDDALIVNGKSITVYAEKEARNIPWESAGAELIVECTGFYTSTEKAQAHLSAGVAHRLNAVGNQLRIAHQAGAEHPVLHAVRRAADVEVDLIVAARLRQLRTLRQRSRIATAQL